MDPSSLERLIERLETLAEGAEEWEQVRAPALKWALNRGSRSGRSACQFARDRVGRRQLGETG